MPGKSKKGKKKRYQQTKQTQNLPRQNDVATPAPAAATAVKAAAPVPTKPSGKAAAAIANAVTNQYTYITGDLRNIGILTGIIIVILFVLYFIIR
jgi:hypothetical protein